MPARDRSTTRTALCTKARRPHRWENLAGQSGTGDVVVHRVEQPMEPFQGGEGRRRGQVPAGGAPAGQGECPRSGRGAGRRCPAE